MGEKKVWRDGKFESRPEEDPSAARVCNERRDRGDKSQGRGKRGGECLCVQVGGPFPSQVNLHSPTRPLRSHAISCLTMLSRILLLVFSPLLRPNGLAVFTPSSVSVFDSASFLHSSLPHRHQVSLFRLVVFHRPSHPHPPTHTVCSLLSQLSPSSSLCLLPSSLLWLLLPISFPPCPLPWIYPRDPITNLHPCSQVPSPLSLHSLRSSRPAEAGNCVHTTDSPPHPNCLSAPPLSLPIPPSPSPKTKKTRKDKGMKRIPPDRSLVPAFAPVSSAPVNPLQSHPPVQSHSEICWKFASDCQNPRYPR